MMSGFLPIDEHVPRGTWKTDLRAVHFLGDMDLAAEPASVRKSECEIEHVVFVV